MAVALDASVFRISNSDDCRLLVDSDDVFRAIDLDVRRMVCSKALTTS